jgi:hypothetical protein
MVFTVNASPDIFKTRLPSLAVSSPTALASYGKNFHDPACVHAMCEDYRASSPGGGQVPQGPDYALDKSDLENANSGRRVKCDLMVLWGERGIVGKFWDVKQEWRKFCVGEVVGRAVDSGHYIPEGTFMFVMDWKTQMKDLRCRNGHSGVGGRDFRLFQGVGMPFLAYAFVILSHSPNQDQIID